MSMNRRNSVSLANKEASINYVPIASDENEDVFPGKKETRFCCVPCCGVRFLPRWLVITGTSFGISIPLILVVIFFILPIFVQDLVSGSGLQFTSVSITQPQENQFALTAEGYLLNVGPLAAEISETNITVEYQGSLLGNMTMPSITAQGSSTAISVTSVFYLANLTLYEEYIKTLINADGTSVDWVLKGSPTIKAVGMSWQVNFEKVVSIMGMGGLKNVTVIGLDLPRNSPFGGVEIFLNATQYNPSTISVSIGTIDLEFYYQNSFMGKVWTNNFTLHSGSNLLSLQGYMKPENTTIAGVFMSNYLAGVDAEVQIQGIDAGDSPVSWVQYMVKLLNIPSILPGAKNLTLMHDINLQTLEMEFVSNTEIYAGSSIVAGFNSPFNFPLDIIEVSTFIEMVSNGQLFGSITGPFFPARSDQTLGKVWVSFQNAPTKVINEILFSDLVNDLLLYSSATTTLNGIARVIASTAMGNLTLTGIKFGQDIIIPGMSGLSTPPITVISQSILSAVPGSLQVDMVLAITNPSNLALKAPNLPLYLVVNGTTLGNSSLTPLEVSANSTENHLTHNYVVQDGANNDVVNAFVSANVMAQPVNVTVKGASDKVTIDVMKKALSNFQAQIVIPGVAVNFVTFLQLQISLEIFQGYLPTKLTIKNPWPIDIRILNIHQDVYITSNNQKIAYLYEDISSSPIVVPALQTIITAPQPVRMDGISIEELEALSGKGVPVTMTGTLQSSVGSGFLNTLYYTEIGVPCSIWSSK